MCRQEARTQRRRWLALRRDSCGFDQNGLRLLVQGRNSGSGNGFARLRIGDRIGGVIRVSAILYEAP